jgi:O-antigen ligase
VTPAASPDRPHSAPWIPVAFGIAFVGFLVVLLQPRIFNPFALEPGTAWTLVCYSFAIPVMLLHRSGRSSWRPTFVDYVLAAYVLIVLVTWPTSLNPRATGIAVIRLAGQLAVFYAVRHLVETWSALARVVVATLIVGIAALTWTATMYHLRYGLSVRLADFPPLDWNGRQGLGFLGAIQFALLVGSWQQAQSRAVEVGTIVLIIGSVVELVFLYSRDPWVASGVVIVGALFTTIRLGGIRRFILPLGIIVAVLMTVRTPFVVHLARMAAGLEQGREGGLDVRLASWRYATTIIGQRPFAGMGLGNFVTGHRAVYPVGEQFLFDERYFGAGPEHPHNLFLQQTAETGVFGGLAYVAIWATGIWAGWVISTRRTNTVGSNSLFYGLLAVVVMNVGENMFLDGVAAERVRLHTLGWMLLACVIAEWNGLQPLEAAPRERVS